MHGMPLTEGARAGRLLRKDLRQSGSLPKLSLSAWLGHRILPAILRNPASAVQPPSPKRPGRRPPGRGLSQCSCDARNAILYR